MPAAVGSCRMEAKQMHHSDVRAVNAGAALGRMIALAGVQEANRQHATVASERAITNRTILLDSILGLLNHEDSLANHIE
jgi:hypothetical protein